MTTARGPGESIPTGKLMIATSHEQCNTMAKKVWNATPFEEKAVAL
jgi:hypothetical protein